jgi:hypothetical protein
MHKKQVANNRNGGRFSGDVNKTINKVITIVETDNLP